MSLKRKQPLASAANLTPTPAHRAHKQRLLSASIEYEELDKYGYRGLNKETEIRLLKVNRTAENEFQYQIEHTTLTLSPPYETVSYVWGDDARHSILSLCDRKTLMINNTISTALRYLSFNCETGYLWIDQICIDQESIEERNHQVKLMGKIYQNSQRVLVWLGEESLFGGSVKKLIQIVEHSDEAKESFSLMKERLLSALYSDRVKIQNQMLRILENSWFSRAWVFQEIVLSKEATFIDGDSTAPFHALYRVSRTVSGMYTSSDIFNAENEAAGVIPSKSGSTIVSLRQMKSVQVLTMMYYAWWHGSHNQLSSLEFYQLLSKMSPILDASDPKDIVYAFLGLNTNPRSLPWPTNIVIEPNYSLNYNEMLIQTAVSLIQGMKSLDLFEDLRRSSFNTLPSWVPDWKAELHCSPIRGGRMIYAKGVSLGRQHSWRKLSNDYELYVRGRVIGVINQVYNHRFRPMASDWKNEDLEKYLNLDVRLDELNKLLPSFWEKMSSRRFIEVLTTGPNSNELSIDGFGPCSNSTSELVDAFQRYVKNKDGANLSFGDEFLLRSLRYYLYISRWRRIFLSNSYRMGLSCHAEPGDQICILHGCTSPVILRQLDSTRFKVVDNCYFEGAMGGDSVTWDEDEADEFILV